MLEHVSPEERLSMMRFALEHGFNPNSKCWDGCLVLRWASLLDDVGLMRMLILRIVIDFFARYRQKKERNQLK
jgi:hypothetical protein